MEVTLERAGNVHVAIIRSPEILISDVDNALDLIGPRLGGPGEH
jgi:hypothetical protein